MGKKKLCDGETKDKAHYWVLDDKSFGVCKKCGAKKQFLFQGWEWQKRKVVIGKKSHGQTD
jgi:hypothetical protein